MNEHIDILLTTAKVASRNNQWASLATHTISMGYNVSMLWHYQYELGLASAMGPSFMTAEQIQRLKQERLKHTVLGLLDGMGVFLSAAGSMHK
jgi:hypothetical protein